MPPVAKALTIAGSDSGGGAGIQADLKTFSALGVYGASAITALTAQNTQTVSGIYSVPPDFVSKQINAVLEDIKINAIKIGMLATAPMIEAVAETLGENIDCPIILDPVMVAKSGDRLLEDDAVEAIIKHFPSKVDVITPNLPEASALLGMDSFASSEKGMMQTAALLAQQGWKAILLKGGHLEGSHKNDVLYYNGQFSWFREVTVPTKNTHGTGCSLSSALAAHMAKGHDLPQATGESKKWLSGALRYASSLEVGQGHGPVHHFYALWPNTDD